MYKLITIVLALALLQESLALKCYFCDPACEPSKADERTCGSVAGENQEAICTTERATGMEKSSMAVRRCQIVRKGEDPVCSSNGKCSKCTSDLCNAAPSTSLSGVALAGLIMAYFVPKLIH